VSGKGAVNNANAAINGAEIKRWGVSMLKDFPDVAVPQDTNPRVRSAGSLAIFADASRQVLEKTLSG
jgi:hypothetical protein